VRIDAVFPPLNRTAVRGQKGMACALPLCPALRRDEFFLVVFHASHTLVTAAL
jgi:hypothetical protein